MDKINETGEKRYWLRGGISILLFWGLFIIIVGLILVIIGNCSVCEGLGACEQHIIDCFTEFGINYYFPLLILGISIEQTFTMIILSTLVWFVIGVLLGYLYGKIKNRNEGIK